MNIFFDVMRLIVSIIIAMIAGKLVSWLKLPSILGWLITGMIIGPHALNFLGDSVLNSTWFDTLESLLE